MWDPAQYSRFRDERSRPFFELLARIRATLRRKPTTDLNATLLEAGEFRIDLGAQEAFFPAELGHANFTDTLPPLELVGLLIRVFEQFDRPILVFLVLGAAKGVDQIASFVIEKGGLAKSTA